MGNIGSRLTRQYYRFNAENRAHRIIKQGKPLPAPKHEKTQQQIKMLEQELPAKKEELKTFDPSLHDRLKKVYVSSSEAQPDVGMSRNFPPLSHEVRRTAHYGFDDDVIGAEGRIMLKHLLQMLTKYTKDDTCRIEDLAKEYKLKLADAENIVKYYRCFTLQMPFDQKDKQKYINTILIGNEEGEILSTTQFLERLVEEKGVRKGITKGVPLLNSDMEEIARQEEMERRKKLARSSEYLKKLASGKDPEEDRKTDEGDPTKTEKTSEMDSTKDAKSSNVDTSDEAKSTKNRN